MSKISQILVFSDNRDTKGTFISFANLHEAHPSFKEKNKVALQSLTEMKFDLILIEILHPVMSEIEFVDQVYSLARNTPIIILSSYFYDTKDIVFGEKIAGFIMKPFTVEQIVTETEHIFSQRTAQPEIIEEQKQTKVDQVLYESKKLSVLLEISKSINSIKDFDELLHRIIILAADALGAERATLFIADKKRKELWSRSGIGLEKQEIRIPIDKGIAGEVAMSGQSQIIDKPYEHPKFNKEIDIKTGFKTRNILTLPMKNFNGEVIGVFQILNKKSGDFNKEDEQFLSAMAVNTGIALENALLHEEIKKQLEEVKRSYDELYIAQNQIVKEVRFVTYSEIVGFVKGIISKGSDVDSIAKEVKRLYPFDPQLKKQMDSIQNSYTAIQASIDEFLEEKKKEIRP